LLIYKLVIIFVARLLMERIALILIGRIGSHTQLCQLADFAPTT